MYNCSKREYFSMFRGFPFLEIKHSVSLRCSPTQKSCLLRFTEFARYNFKVTRHLCFKNSKNLQLLDDQACKRNYLTV